MAPRCPWEACQRAWLSRHRRCHVLSALLRAAFSVSAGGKSQSWIAYPLCFGRFLNFTTTVVNDESVLANLTEALSEFYHHGVILLANLTEGQFLNFATTVANAEFTGQGGQHPFDFDPLEPRDVQQRSALLVWSFSFFDFRVSQRGSLRAAQDECVRAGWRGSHGARMARGWGTWTGH